MPVAEGHARAIGMAWLVCSLMVCTGAHTRNWCWWEQNDGVTDLASPRICNCDSASPSAHFRGCYHPWSIVEWKHKGGGSHISPKWGMPLCQFSSSQKNWTGDSAIRAVSAPGSCPALLSHPLPFALLPVLPPWAFPSSGRSLPPWFGAILGVPMALNRV